MLLLCLVYVYYVTVTVIHIIISSNYVIFTNGFCFSGELLYVLVEVFF